MQKRRRQSRWGCGCGPGNTGLGFVSGEEPHSGFPNQTNSQAPEHTKPNRHHQAAPLALDELADDEERLFAQQLIDKISSWLAGSEPTLEIPRVGPGYAKLQEQVLSSGPFGAARGVEAPGFIVDYIGSSSSSSGGSTGGGAGGSTNSSGGGSDGGSVSANGSGGGSGTAAGAKGMLLVLRRAAPGEVAAAAAASDQALAAGLDDAAGFSLVLEAMRGCGKPAVAHNMRFDLAFVLQQFVGQLPGAWRDFKQMAGVYWGCLICLI